MICSGDFAGKGRSRSPFTIPKMAVLAPMPSASVRTTITVSIGDFASILRAYRVSSQSVVMNVPPPSVIDRHVPIHKPMLWIYMLSNNLERLMFLTRPGRWAIPRRGAAEPNTSYIG